MRRAAGAGIMTPRVTSIFLLALLLMASCTLVAPDVHYDWCYIYNFGVSDQGVNLLSGTWVEGQGLTTDETGLLQVNWTHDRYVNPHIVLVKAVRPEGVTGAISVTANALVFGVNVAFTETLPSELNEVTLNFQPDSSAIQSGGTAVNAVLESSQPIAIQYVEVRGNFASPFDVNYCGQPSETVTATQIYTATPGDTLTPEPSATVDPAELYWWVEATQEIDDYLSYPTGHYQQSWEVPVHSGAGIYNIGYAFIGQWIGGPNCGTGTTCYARLAQQDNINYRLYHDNGVLTLCDINDGSIFGLSDAQRIEKANAFCQLHFGVNDLTGRSPWNISTGVTTVQASFNYTSPVNPSGGTIIGTWYAIQGAYGYQPTTTPTTYVLPTDTPTRTPLPTVPGTTPTPSRTPFLFPTRVTPDTSTPLPSTNTPEPSTATRTPYPAPTPFITPTADPEGYDPNIENEAEWEILNQIGNVWNEIRNGAEDLADFTGRVADWANGSMKNAQTGIDNLGKEFAGYMEGFSNLITDIYQTGQLTIDMTRTLFNLSFGWFQDATTRINNIFGQFFNTPAKLIPGLPQCISNPTAYELCAIWWTLDWTLFAPNTPGDAIVPLLTIALNIGIVMYFVQMVLRLVRKVEVVANELAAE